MSYLKVVVLVQVVDVPHIIVHSVLQLLVVTLDPHHLFHKLYFLKLASLLLITFPQVCCLFIISVLQGNILFKLFLFESQLLIL